MNLNAITYENEKLIKKIENRNISSLKVIEYLVSKISWLRIESE